MKVIGIDLGTSSSAAAVMIDGEVKIIPLDDKSGSLKPLPSVVSFFKDGSGLVGVPAVEQAIYNPDGVIFNIKRKMGKNESVKIFDEEYKPQYISALILLKIKLYAEKFLHGEEVTKAIITVPSDFTDAQRQATKDAGKIAGLDVLQVLPEQEAAVIAHDLRSLQGLNNVLVFDIGAGTVDVSVIEIDDGFLEVKATAGNSNVGGIDIDKVISQLIQNELAKKNSFDGLDETQKSQLRRISERIKIDLSEKDEVSVDETIYSSQKTTQISFKITRKELESAIIPLLEKCQACVKEVLKNADMTKDSIDRVIMVGGPTQMPIFREILTDLIKAPEEKVDGVFAVCRGAAIQGAIMGDGSNLPVVYQGLQLLSTTALDYGEISKVNGELEIEIMIPKNTPYPTEKTKNFVHRNFTSNRAKIQVWQGDFEKSTNFSDCVEIGLDYLEPLSSKIPREIQVTYKIDADGILTVTAREIGESAFLEFNISKHGAGMIPPKQLSDLSVKVEKQKKKMWQHIMSPYEIPVGEYNSKNSKESEKYCWMCDCLAKAKEIIIQHHNFDCREFLSTAQFPLSIQSDRQYAYGYIRPGGMYNPISIHNALKENTDRNQRMLVVVFIHELLHAIHPDWGHDKINPEERRLANLGMYFDAIKEMEILFLSGKMCLCNNEISDSDKDISVNCKS